MSYHHVVDESHGRNNLVANIIEGKRWKLYAVIAWHSLTILLFHPYSRSHACYFPRSIRCLVGLFGRCICTIVQCSWHCLIASHGNARHQDLAWCHCSTRLFWFMGTLRDQLTRIFEEMPWIWNQTRSFVYDCINRHPNLRTKPSLSKHWWPRLVPFSCLFHLSCSIVCSLLPFSFFAGVHDDQLSIIS